MSVVWGWDQAKKHPEVRAFLQDFGQAVRPLIEAELRAQIADDIRRLGSGFRPDGLFEHGFSAGLYAAEQATRGE